MEHFVRKNNHFFFSRFTIVTSKIKPFITIFLDVKDLLPEILQHLGPKQLGDLKDLLSTMGGEKKETADDGDIP